MAAVLLLAMTAVQGAEGQKLLREAGVRGGLVVHVGCGDGRMTAELGAGESYLAHGLDADAGNVAEAREHVRKRGLAGPVAVDLWRGGPLPYVDNLVNLVVLEKPDAAPMREVMRVLCPGGVVCVKKGGAWRTTVKPRPDEIDEWTHALHGPDNNAVAHDRVVGPPRHLQWVGSPRWARSHDHLSSFSVAVSAGGRLFAIADHAPAATVALPPSWWLIARDAFNGVVLWKRRIAPWEDRFRGFRTGPSELSRRLVAVGDRVYVTLGYGKPATALDAATGETLKTYAGTANALELVQAGGTLYVVVGDAPAAGPLGEEKPPGGERPAQPRGRNRGYVTVAPRKHLQAVHAETGELLWKKADADTVDLMPTTLAVSGGRVFFQSPEHVICLRADSGEERWRAERPVRRGRPAWSAPTLVVHGDVVLSADRAAPDLAREKKAVEGGERVRWLVSSAGGQAPPGELIAFSARDGSKLWACKCREIYNAPVDVLVAGGLVWTGDMVRANDPGITLGRDPVTGEVRKTRPPDRKFFRVGMGHHRCYRNKATDRYLVLGRAGVEMIDLATGEGVPHHWVRGACQYGVVPCNGLLYTPPHSCACYIRSKLNGFNALAPKRTGGPARSTGERLERGPAYEAAVEAKAGADDWPTYRCDPARNGRTKAAVPAEPERLWQTKIGGRLSSVVVGGGRVYVAEIEAHNVHALDAADGTPRWTVTAGGRVDSPPTVWEGRVLFGSADGYVYCVRASDGVRMWRYRAAPADQRLVAYGRLESVWPVHGSVLVRNGVVWCAAGRSSFLDGGIRLLRLDATTGKKLSETVIDSRDPKTGREPQRAVRGTAMGAGALPDVLSCDGTSVYMRHVRFDLEGKRQRGGPPHLYSSVGFLDGSWWHRTYWLAGATIRSGYGGWPVMGSQAPSGRLLVLDGDTVYGYGRNVYAAHGSHAGLGKVRYRLFAVARKPEPVGKPGAPLKRRRPRRTKVRYHWQVGVPIVARAMVLADKTLFLAGPADDGFRSVGMLEGAEGGRLMAVSTADGKTLSDRKLGAVPVFDGLAAAGGRLYLATKEGAVACYGEK
jgi:outer membrane protein assembly factor BamB